MQINDRDKNTTISAAYESTQYTIEDIFTIDVVNNNIWVYIVETFP